MDPFETLGLARRYDLDLPDLERRYRDLQRALHPDRHVGAAASQRRLTLGKAVEVNEAYRVLRDDLKRAQALLAVLGGSEPSGQAVDPELLMEVMELREELSDAKHAKDLPRVRALAARVDDQRMKTQAALASAFAQLGPQAQVDEAELRPAGALISKLKYLQRFLDEARVIEDEAQG